MVTSTATTVDAYLAALPPERREVAAALRALIRRHLPEGYAEAMTWGMPTYEVPLDRHPDTYNGKPLAYVAFAAQKNNYALYLMCVSSDGAQERTLREAAAVMGTTLDMGKSCVRFRALDRLPLDAIGALIASHPVDDCIALYEAARATSGSAGAAKNTAAKKAAAKNVAKKRAAKTPAAKKPPARAKAAPKRG
jgi:hypothetical protein